jgi:hypothetical protein
MTKEKGKGKKKAIVAIARRLGVLYTLMKKGTRYEVRHFRPGKEADMKRMAAEALSA